MADKKPPGALIGTPDRELRPQIEAIKVHLSAEGLADIEELLTKTFEGFHTIHATFNNKPHLLRLSYEWLSDNPQQEQAVAWLQEKEVARILKGDVHEILILAKGTIQIKTVRT